MADGAMSRYFEQDRVKRARQAGPTGYATVGGEAPVSTNGGSPAPAAPSGPKAPASTGGSGFVNFGQYFGANAPAVQAQAQKATVNAKDFGALNVMQGPGGMGQGAQPPSAFDAMLGQGTTSREAAKEGQNRFKQLSARFADGVDTTMGGKAISQAQQAQAQAQAQQAQATQEQQARQARDERNAESFYRTQTLGQGLAAKPWNQLSEAEKQQYRAQSQALYGDIAF